MSSKYFLRIAVMFTTMSLMLTGCADSLSVGTPPLDASVPSTTVQNDFFATSSFLSDKETKSYKCKRIWSCLPIEVTSNQDCRFTELTFNVFDTAGKEELVHSAKGGWRDLRAGTSVIEFGINNVIQKQVSYTLPTFRCLKKQQSYEDFRAMVNLPSDYCDAAMPMYCTSMGEIGFMVDSYNKNPLGGGYVGGGYEVVCNDGWVSQSGGIQGACSHHGGVSG